MLWRIFERENLKVPRFWRLSRASELGNGVCGEIKAMGFKDI